MKLKIKKTRPDAIVPKYATSGAACFDLHAADDRFEHIGPCSVRSMDPVTFGTGLSFEVPEGFVLLIFSRSGHGFNHDTRLANCVGVIDSDYRGEVKVRLSRDTSTDTAGIIVRPGDRIAQAMLVQIPRVELEVVEELTTTERGAAGFGSTGNT